MQKTAKGNWPLYCAWIVVLAITIGISFSYHLESTSFSGIAETREIVVNSETAVDIRRIHVSEGQAVEKGALLVELSSPDLVLRINHIEHQLDELKAQKGVDKTEIQSRIRQLQAEKTAKENEITSQIAELENQYNINKNLLSDLKSIPLENGIDADEENSPIKLKIRNLKKELSLSVNPLVVQIDLLQNTLDNSNAPVEIQVERLEKELSLLRRENSQLNIYARISGIIGSVNFKAGEKVSPFSPILTLHTKTPSFIKGYIYENAYAQIKMGDKVDVTSFGGTENIVKGQVVGIGARIVEYPVRLRKHPDFQVWGREIVIRIPENNPFILGEKVSITAAQRNQGFATRIRRMFSPDEIMAETRSKNSKTDKSDDDQFIKIDKKSLEASGILYLDDLQEYLVISDETPDDKPVLYLMDSKGGISDEVFIEGSGKIEDMESVAEAGNGILYIASSSSVNKKGKLKARRSRLISLYRDKLSFSLLREVDLYSCLKACAEKNSGKEWADFILNGIADESIDIEAMFYKEGALCLGFKAPLRDGQSVILRIADVDSFMYTGELSADQVSIWKKITLSCGDGSSQERISDFCYVNGSLFITGTSENNDDGGRSGSLWRLDETSGTAVRLMVFNGRAPEGVSASDDPDSLLVCFDGGSKEKSEIIKITRPWAADLQ